MSSHERPPSPDQAGPGSSEQGKISPAAPRPPSARPLWHRPWMLGRAASPAGSDPLSLPRWALMLGILLTLLLFLALLVVFFLPGVASGMVQQSINFDKPTKDWYEGPVRYIITHQEVKAFKALETELDRANFIDWFWQRRDINPDTPENEFRDRFEQRVYEATRMFNDTSKPGWKTDMGKVYILVGPPDEMNKDLMGKTHRGIVTWVYRRPPFPDLPANTVIGFARDMSGEFRISVSPTLDSDVARGLKFQKVMRTADDQLMFIGRDPALLAAGAPLSQGELDTAMMFSRLQQLPPGEEALFKTMVTAREFFGSIPADSRFDFYRAPEGATYTTVTIGIKSSAVQYKQQGDHEVPDVGVFGKLINKNDPDQVYPLASDSAFVEGRENETAGPGDLLVFQATGAFKPGVYQLVLGVQDRVSKKIASYRKEIMVPDLSPKVLSISSVTLAGKMEPTDRVWASGKPFYVGKFHIVPRPDSAFAKTDELNLYFQVYDPATDEASGKPRLGVVYTFRHKKPDGALEDIGRYEVKESTGQVQGYAVPLEKWPPGAYSVVVKVTDAVASKSVVSPPAEFTIKP